MELRRGTEIYCTVSPLVALGEGRISVLSLLQTLQVDV